MLAARVHALASHAISSTAGHRRGPLLQALRRRMPDDGRRRASTCRPNTTMYASHSNVEILSIAASTALRAWHGEKCGRQHCAEAILHPAHPTSDSTQTIPHPGPSMRLSCTHSTPPTIMMLTVRVALRRYQPVVRAIRAPARPCRSSCRRPTAPSSCARRSVTVSRIVHPRSYRLVRRCTSAAPQ